MLFMDIGRYIVFSDGKIWSKKYKKILKPRISSGYSMVAIYQGERYDILIHQLVAMCFLNDWSSDLTVNHIDENKENNNDWNLEMMDMVDNVKYSCEKRVRSIRASQGKSVIRSDGKIYETMRDVQKDGFTYSIVQRCCSGKLKTHKGYGWKLYNGGD